MKEGEDKDSEGRSRIWAIRHNANLSLDAS